MGTSKSRQANKKIPDPEGYCFYSSSSTEQHTYIKLEEEYLNLSLGQGNAPFKSIKIDRTFRIVSEIPDKRCIIIEYHSSKGLSSCVLRLETIQDYQMWSNFLKSLKRPKWDDHNSLFCKICAKEFNFFRRQHHCRMCGIVVCKSHAKNKAWLHELGYNSKERICNGCFKNRLLA